MKVLLHSAIAVLAAGILTSLPLTTSAAEPLPRSQANLSLRNEVQLAIDKGLAWLQKQQQPDGSWSNAEHPSLTALPLIAVLREPTGKYDAQPKPEFIQKALAFLRSKAQPDGGIYTAGLSNYNTSLCLVALLEAGNPQDEKLITAARDFVAGMQAKNMAKGELDGGIGYGSTGVSPKRQHPDLDNTLIALEALRTYRAARPQAEFAAGKDLDWQAAIDFITRCQNLPEKNPKASTDPVDRGGFVYYPGFSNAAPADGSAPLRSYGTMTYAGLLSFIYADLQKDDARVTTALDWLSKNYTLEENPGLGRQGLFYYYHLMAKGLAAAGSDKFAAADGKQIDWARELALKLINLQNGDGSWVNDTARWMEKDPVLVTSYCLLALEIVYQRL
jgi:squalene-hopene/tetraprenyl-beta-curcumene cyclase